VGRRVQVCSGALAGMSGILVRRKSQYRLVVSVDLIQRSIAADLDVCDIAPVPDGPRTVTAVRPKFNGLQCLAQEAR
jgi:hypothetical protein